jgi:hypothetical protein
MDRVTESFVSKFVDEHELSAVRSDVQFEHFTTFVTVRRHYNGETFDTADIHTGSGGDLGIDAVAILVNGSLVTDVESLDEHGDISGHFDVIFIFVQADRGSSFDGKKLSDFGFGVKDFFSPEPRLKRNSAIVAASEVMDALYKQGTKFRPGNPICRLYFVTTGTWVGDPDLEARRKAVEDDLRSLQIFRDVEFACLGAAQLQQMYRLTQNAVAKEFTFANRTLLPEIEGVTESYIGFLPLQELIDLVKDDNGEMLGTIFADNVRGWQEYTAPVNDEIRETIASNHTDRFVVMNNGITMIARTLRPLRGNRFAIEDFQIVNGCQTTNVLFDQYQESGGNATNIQVPFRLIATQDEEVVKSIIRGTNRQTKVEEDQFFALTEFAEHLEDYFQTFPEPSRVYYERRSGQYAGKAIHNTRIVPHRSLVRHVASMFLELPHQATRSYKSISANVGKEIFAKGQRLEPYYVSAFAAYKLDVNFRTGRIDARLKAARFHILLAMRYLAKSADLPWMNAKEMERYCTTIMEVLWAGGSDDLCARAALIVEEVAMGDFHRDAIRTQPFTEKLILRCRKETGR